MAFKGVNGLYLARSFFTKNNIKVEAALANSPNITASALWTPEYQPNGTYAFKSDNGKYLGRLTTSLLSVGYYFGTNSTAPAAHRDNFFVFYDNTPIIGPATYINTNPSMPNAGIVKLMSDSGISMRNGYFYDRSTAYMTFGDGP